MDKQKIDLYLVTNVKYFEPSAIPIIRTKLENATEETLLTLQACELKDPTVLLLISIFLGSFGIDRFMLGDTGMGVLKLLTAGCCGILTIIDWFSITKKVKQKNLLKIGLLSFCIAKNIPICARIINIPFDKSNAATKFLLSSGISLLFKD